MNKKVILAGVAALLGIGLVIGIVALAYGNSLSEATADQQKPNISAPVEPKTANGDHGDSTVQTPEPSSQDNPGDADQPAHGTTDDPQGGDQNDANPDKP